MSYSPNAAYLACYRISALKDAIKYFTTFFASKFFSLFSPSKTEVRLMVQKVQYLYLGTVLLQLLYLFVLFKRGQWKNIPRPPTYLAVLPLVLETNYPYNG